MKLRATLLDLIPKTVLMKGAKELQPGRLVVDSSWTQPAGGGEFVTQTDVQSAIHGS